MVTQTRQEPLSLRLLFFKRALLISFKCVQKDLRITRRMILNTFLIWVGNFKNRKNRETGGSLTAFSVRAPETGAGQVLGGG